MRCGDRADWLQQAERSAKSHRGAEIVLKPREPFEGAAGRPCGVGAGAAGFNVRCGAGRGGVAHSTGTCRWRIRGIMRKHPDAQRR